MVTLPASVAFEMESHREMTKSGISWTCIEMVMGERALLIIAQGTSFHSRRRRSVLDPFNAT